MNLNAGGRASSHVVTVLFSGVTMLRSTFAIAALAVGFAAAPAVVRAQAAAPTDSGVAVTPTQHHRHHRHPLFRGITLSDSQRTQLRAIHAKYAPQFRDARQANDRATMKQLHAQMVDDARGVLTPDQQQQFDTNRASMKSHRKSPSGATPAPQPTPTPNS
jgi:Spy/CpxP family protein refolding chaperone